MADLILQGLNFLLVFDMHLPEVLIQGFDFLFECLHVYLFCCLSGHGEAERSYENERFDIFPIKHPLNSFVRES